MLSLILMALTQISIVHAGYLDGIGYRRQELQQAKGAQQAGENPTGIPWASMAGGTHIFIKGAGMADNSQSNIPVLYSHQFDYDLVSLPLSEDDSFNSHASLGHIAYRLPAIDELFALPYSYLDQYDVYEFTLYLYSYDDNGIPHKLRCQNTALCYIKYARITTPKVFWTIPRVVYADADVQLFMNPMSVPNLVSGVKSDDKAFINAKIGGMNLDFEEYEDGYTWYNANSNYWLKGKVGELPANDDLNVTMLWETGLAHVPPVESLTCSFDNSTCYRAKSVPVIYEISSNTGYSTGG